MQQRFKQTIVSARYGGITEATKRLLAQLPICAQSYSSSPYLDLSLFCYDDKWVSMMERPKACGEHPIWYKRLKQKKLLYLYKIFFKFYCPTIIMLVYLQLLRTRFWAVKVQDVCGSAWQNHFSVCEKISRLHLPSHRPICNIRATDQRRIHCELPRSSHLMVENAESHDQIITKKFVFI